MFEQDPFERITVNYYARRRSVDFRVSKALGHTHFDPSNNFLRDVVDSIAQMAPTVDTMPVGTCDDIRMG